MLALVTGAFLFHGCVVFHCRYHTSFICTSIFWLGYRILPKASFIEHSGLQCINVMRQCSGEVILSWDFWFASGIMHWRVTTWTGFWEPMDVWEVRLTRRQWVFGDMALGTLSCSCSSLCFLDTILCCTGSFLLSHLAWRQAQHWTGGTVGWHFWNLGQSHFFLLCSCSFRVFCHSRGS